MKFSHLPSMFPSGRKPLRAFTCYDRASVLAREVRNPLTCINLSVDLLNSAPTDTELKVYTDIVARSSNRINQLMKELLECQEVGTLSNPRRVF